MSLHYTSKHRLCDSTKATRQGWPLKPHFERKDDLRRRDVHIQLWLNEKEAEALSRNADRCRLTQSAYLRHLIMGYVPREAPPLDYRAMMQQIYHVGRSLNQIAAKAHVLNVVDTQRYDESVRMLENAILKIEDAVIVPQKMEKEGLLDDCTAQES